MTALITYLKPLSITAAALSGMQSGFNFDISLITIPIILATRAGTATQVSQWRQCYDTGHAIIPGGALVATALHLTNAYTAHSSSSLPFSSNTRAVCFALAALSQVCIVPFTILFIAPTNNVLFGIYDGFAEGKDKVSAEAVASVPGLIGKWSGLNFVRGFFGLGATVLSMYAMWE